MPKRDDAFRGKSRRQLVAKLDKLFSLYIHRRDALPNGIGRCITCGTITTLQCGHFIKRQHMAVRWNPLNAAGQCPRCNHFLHGNEGAFCMALIKKYGQAIVDELLRLKHTTAKFSRGELIDRILNYQAKLDEL